jgi:two-component system, chemotaxis family, CheB/CheR fusion protein
MPKKKATDKKPAKSKSNTSTKVSRKLISKSLTLKRFPIIGLGASAGGLEALKSFFSAVSENSGMAYIVVIHMTPKQPSMMPELLQKVTRVPVSSPKDGQTIESDHIYVVPPGKEIAVYKGKIQLLDLVRHGVVLPIDFFLRSLAQDQGRNATAIILSGTGTDGTLGVKEIKANDGLLIVQDTESAVYDGMPRSAISTGLADMVLPPEKMPKKLVQYFSLIDKATVPKSSTNTTNEKQEWLNKIFAILRIQIGHDFSGYKVNTVHRRLNRRMGVNQIDSQEKYVRFLRKNPSEVEALFRDLLIGVTNFFRDTESFDVLKSSVLPELFGKIKEDATFRIWIPGCSTGEEAYSMAIMLHESLDKTSKRIKLQLFGTDIDNYAIDKAREGLYPANITADVSPGRLKRFFFKEGNFFRICKEIRESVIFSVQNVLKDPPFSRLNLLCCRNLLIYLDNKEQEKLLPLFHYTLMPDGILMLGSSETIGGFTNLFKTLDKKWKIYKRRSVPYALRQPIVFPSGPSTVAPADVTESIVPVAINANIGRITQKAILDQFAPTAILIDDKGEILHTQGRTGKYLETPSGPPTHNIMDLTREGLRFELPSAIRTAKSSGKQVTHKNISVKTNGNLQMINLHVCPQRSPQELAGCFLIVFENIDVDPVVSDKKPGTLKKSLKESSKIAELERELQGTRESHQTTMEELESSNEELKSTNEELQSTNEELQSTNEELESSREELQSLNEELQTVNAELQSKLEELSATHDDMFNLLNSTDIATIFVNNDLCIRRFTNKVTSIINLIETDIGRPLKHVATNLDYDGMTKDINEVMEKLILKEVEVQNTKGDWYIMRIMPYRTTDNRIDGAVLTFTNIGDQKKVQHALRNSIGEIERDSMLVRTLFDLNPDPMAVLDENGRVIIANRALSKVMNVPPEEIVGKDMLDLQTLVNVKADLKLKLKSALKQGKNFKTRAFEIKSSEGKQKFFISSRILKNIEDSTYRVLLQFVNLG